MIAYGWLALLLILAALCVRTIVVLRGAAPWTSAGWCATLAYCAAEGLEVLQGRHLPLHLPYLFLAALTVAFIVAGIRDEPQGEPWWWPAQLGATRRARGAR
jgi:hypothetical protein